jgi:hypothetical protein
MAGADPVADAPPARPAPVAQIVGTTTSEPAAPQAPAPAMAPTATATSPPASASDTLKEALKPVVALLANVTVVTALLVYFGWRRAETHADRLGIDESVLGMTTREYVLRSVGPVLALLVGIAACGLAWMALERRITPPLTTSETAAARLGVAVLGLAWLILPGLVYLLGFVWPATAFVLFPASIGAGALLWVYAARLRRHRGSAAHGQDPDDDHPAADRSSRVVLALVGLLVLVCLFWTASNYAQVLGDRLADNFVGNVDRLPGVVVLSERSLFLDGPGVDEVPLPGSEEEGALQYRYEGLRLLEHTGGHYFLVSDGWSPTYGVVWVLESDDDSIRLDFVRDDRR